MKVVKPIFSKLLNYLATVIVLQCAVAGSLSGQDYKSVLLPMEVNPNAQHMIWDEDRFIVYSLNRIGEGVGSTLLQVDQNLEMIGRSDYIDVFFSRFSPQQIGDRFYAYAADNTVTNRYLLLELDGDLATICIDTIPYFSEDGGVVTMHVQGQDIYGGIVDRKEGTAIGTTMNIKKFSSEDKSELYSIKLDASETYFFSTHMNQVGEDLLVSGNISREVFSYAGVYKVSPAGDVIWQFVSTDPQTRGNVPVLTAVLSNGNIVYTDKVERLELWPEYNDTPARIGWLNSEGDSLMEHIVLVPVNDMVELSGIKASVNEDAFFIFGLQSKTDFQYGIITKFSNSGDTIWSRRYLHPDKDNGFHRIRDIEELPNGDIVTLGRVTIAGNDPSTEIWMMRLNEHGCFGTDTCSDEPLYVSTTELESERMLLHPNPTEGKIYLQNIDLTKVRQIVVAESSGARQLVLESANIGPFIDVSRLSAGSYFVSIYMQDGQVVTERVVKI